MNDSPRYFVGRENILVESYVVSICPNDKDNYLKLCNEGSDKFISHKTVINEINEDEDIIIVQNMKFDIKQIQKLNNRHIFKEDILGNFIFEDGFYCDYDSTDVKLKLI